MAAGDQDQYIYCAGSAPAQPLPACDDGKEYSETSASPDIHSAVAESGSISTTVSGTGSVQTAASASSDGSSTGSSDSTERESTVLLIVSQAAGITFGVTFGVAVAFSLAIGLFFGLYPVGKAARKPPMEALQLAEGDYFIL